MPMSTLCEHPSQTSLKKLFYCVICDERNLTNTHKIISNNKSGTIQMGNWVGKVGGAVSVGGGGSFAISPTFLNMQTYLVL